MTKTMPHETEFQACVENQIRKAIRRAKTQGTTAIGRECLKQLIRPPTNVEGAPIGANAQWQFTQIFNEICTRKGIREFLLP